MYSQNTEQDKKTVTADRTETPPVIDGFLNDACWKTAVPADNFIQYGPYNGSPPSQQTSTWFIYDNTALYVGFMMYDSSPDSIYRGLGKRDELETINADLVSVDIMPYNDGLNMFEFKISASGVVSDVKYSPLGQYPAWDAIWEARTSTNDSGWVAEVRIPFDALRFPNVEEQVWGINMWRSVKRNGEWSTWDFVDKSQTNVLSDYGVLKGIKDIKPGLRLSLYPYVSFYAEKFPGNEKMSYIPNGGMDLKYGLSESFTLDATLIPDFGQVQSDDKVLNLTPFEIKYNEKRQFFVEGTELFSKCNLFYSRRIGGTPMDYYSAYSQTDSSEIVKSNPENARLINATKISGRTKWGLGIGVFNAMTSNTIAIIEDTLTGKTRQINTQPFTNYSLIVLDQNLPNNSYLSVVNSNVYTLGNEYTANVTGTEFKLSNKKNNYSLTGNLKASKRMQPERDEPFGLLYKIGLSKTSGALQFSLNRQEIDDKFDPNDMGYLQNNNEIITMGTINYTLLKPKLFWLSWNHNMSIIHSEQFTGHNFAYLTLEANSYLTFRNFMSARISISSSPVEMVDYYESRIPGRKFVRSGYAYYGAGYSTDEKRKVTFQAGFSYMQTLDNVQNEYTLELAPRIRFSDKFQLAYSLSITPSYDQYGFYGTAYDSTGNITIYFSKRDLSTIVNLISGQYIFNPRSSLTIRCRHYWSKAIISELAVLNNDGDLVDFTAYSGDDINFNIFNTDLQYTWNFAPGSELSVVWKNIISNSGIIAEPSYYKNFSNLMHEPQGNSFSIKILYYLDYKYVFRNHDQT